jgi:hypothetical protein
MVAPGPFDPFHEEFDSESQQGRALLTFWAMATQQITKINEWHDSLPDGEIKSEMKQFLIDAASRYAAVCREVGLDVWLQKHGSN